jgi:predicted PurR-regulated permease PerM
MRMSELSIAALLIGLLGLTGGTISLLAPAKVRAGVAAFPRSVWPGRILVAIDLVWAAYQAHPVLMHFIAWDGWRMVLIWLTPVLIYIGIKYLDELLSPRALGGFLLVAAGPVLDVARWHPSEWRLVVTTMVYLWILVGLVLLMSPWWFRRIAGRLTGLGDHAVRITGAIKAAAGLGLIALALLVY